MSTGWYGCVEEAVVTMIEPRDAGDPQGRKSRKKKCREVKSWGTFMSGEWPLLNPMDWSNWGGGRSCNAMQPPVQTGRYRDGKRAKIGVFGASFFSCLLFFFFFFAFGNRARQMRSIVKLKSLGSRPVKGSADLRDPRSELKSPDRMLPNSDSPVLGS